MLNPKIKDKLYLLLHPLMLALYLWAIILYSAPNYFEKYNAEIISTKPVHDYYKNYYHDLNGNGISNKIIQFYNTGAETPAISYFYNDKRIINQWNLRGSWLLNQKIFFGDYNHNAYAEVYCITRVGDSLFLNAKELLNEKGLVFEDKFICKSKFFNGDKLDAFVIDAKVMDTDNDGKDEFVFTLWSGFSNQPRNTFAYNIVSDSFTKSPISASGFINNLQFMDINGDGVEEITGNISAVENIDYEMPYPDTCSWLMVLNPIDSLNFHFPPIKFDGVFGGIYPVFYDIEGTNYIVSIFGCKSVGNETNGNILQIYDSRGSLINETLLSYDDYESLLLINPLNGNDKNFFLMDSHGKVFVTDTSLNIHVFSKPKFEDLIINSNKSLLLDVDDNGENEILFLAARPSPDKLIIYRSSLKESTIVDLPSSRLTKNWHITLNRTVVDEPPVIALQTDNTIYFIKYGKSAYYLFKYPIYFGTYLLLFFIFWLLQRIQLQYAQRKFEEEKRLIRQQMALSKRQLEPHFMLNILNSIGQMFAAEERKEAQYYFGKFASLIHRGLKYADKTETTLKEELAFIRDYLVLQQRRYGNFEFLIEADDDVDLDKTLIPHSLVYTFVENALKHGLRNKEGKKNLDVIINKQDEKIIITICDNGIGREQSKIKKTSGTGKGLGIINNIIEGYNKLTKRNIAYEVKDLFDENGDSVGTEVRIVV